MERIIIIKQQLARLYKCYAIVTITTTTFPDAFHSRKEILPRLATQVARDLKAHAAGRKKIRTRLTVD